MTPLSGRSGSSNCSIDAEHERGRTLVTFTPDLELVPRVADRVVLLGPDGTVRARGAVREVLTDASLLAAAGLDPPPAVCLFDGVVDDPPLTVEGGRDLLADRLN